MEAVREHVRDTGTLYLDVIVDASWDDLVTGVIKGNTQDLVRVLERMNRRLLPDVPQLMKKK